MVNKINTSVKETSNGFSFLFFFFLSVLIFENSVGDQFNSSNNIKSVAISF